MALLNKASFLNAEDFKYAVVPCPELGGEVRVRGLSAYEQSIISKKVSEQQAEELTVIAVIMGCVDEHGNRIFTADDKEALKQKSFAVLNRISNKIAELSKDEADGVETAVKN